LTREREVKTVSRTEEPSQSVFEVTADETTTTTDRYKWLLDLYVLAPLRILWDDWRARIGGVLLILYLLMGTVGVMLIPEPVFGQGPQLAGFFEAGSFPLGTDNQGRSLLALIVHSTPRMLMIVTGGAVFSTTVATILGTLAGFKGGVVDRVIMTFADVMMAIPGLPLIIVISAILAPKNPFIVGIVLSINAWAGFSRALRAQVLTIREEPYVEAARAIGASTAGILKTDIIPQLMPYIGVSFMQSGRRVIFASVGLYFLGVLPYSGLNWGIILNDAFSSGALWKPEGIHWLLLPTVVIIGLSLSMILLAQGADRLFNARVRARHAKTTSVGQEGEEEDSGPSLQGLKS
jgi:peptide/nickel transport system permease protein